MPRGLGARTREPAPAGAELDLFSFVGAQRRLREVSEAFAHLLGRTPGEVNGRRLFEFVHADDLGALADDLAGLERDRREVVIECRFVGGDGPPAYLQWAARPLPGGDGYRAAGTETADLVNMLADRRDLKARLDLAVGQATAAMWDLDIVEGRLDWEPQAAEMLGVSAATIPRDAAALAAAVHPADSEAVLGALTRLLAEGSADVGLRVGQEPGVRHLSLRGRVLDRDQRGRPLRAVGLLLDVTTERAMEHQLLRISVSDALTGAPNRRAFDRALRGEWRRCVRAREALSIIIVDIDGFKRFNDSFGHLVGDQALVAVARALTAALHREGDLLARYGGEEFAVVVPGAEVAGARAVGQRLLEAVRAVTVRQAPGWYLSVSVGTASWHPGRDTLKSTMLLGRASEALYAAKSGGRDRVVVYEDSLAARHTLQAAMASGLERGEFELYYQPIIGLAGGDVVGFEALMRWNRPEHGLVPPDAFIPVAETSTLICDLGRWAMQDAAGRLAQWSREGLDADAPLRVAVNISARHATSATILADVEAALAQAGIAPDQLELELTETALRKDVIASPYLACVRTLGVRVAIDDFGTGYTSIGELAHLPADALKIDRSFTVSPDPRQQSLVKLMIEAGHAFDLRVVAEGIEEQATLQTLRDLGCDYAQGYLMARPLPADQIAAWVRRWRAQQPPHGA